MSFLEAILLGLLQGATEFLPVSSSGHLVLGERFFGIEEPNLLFTVILHIGTLVAVTLFYHRDVVGAAKGMVTATIDGVKERSLDSFRRHQGARLGVLLILATIPTAIVGLLIDRAIEPAGNPLIPPADIPLFICVMFIINGFVLFSARLFKDKDFPERGGRWTLWNITPMIALLIGLSQGLAAIPGVSRSGTTITVALALGVWRAESARFSFLLSIPAILGALVLKLDPALFATAEGLTTLATYTAAAAVAGIVGYLSIIVLVKMLQKAQFWHFSWYSWAIGILGLWWLLGS